MEVPGRILAVDYGRKRVGLAVTDPLQLIATRLDTVRAEDIWKYLDGYFLKEKVVLVIVGYPMQMNNEPSAAVTDVNLFLRKFLVRYPGKEVRQADERFTSKLAFRALIDGGVKKKDRQNKAIIDGVSATILLQSFLDQKKYTP